MKPSNIIVRIVENCDKDVSTSELNLSFSRNCYFIVTCKQYGFFVYLFAFVYMSKLTLYVLNQLERTL